MSATWDSKALKATPTSSDEILIIDVADSRNQKRATLASFGGAIWTQSGTNIFPSTLTDSVGIGTITPETLLHVESSGATSFYSGATQGIIITDNVAPRIILEDGGEGVDDRSMLISNSNERMTISSITDADAFDVENIMTISRNGNVTLGGIPGTALLQLGQDNNGDLLNFNSDRAWTFGASGSGGSVRLTLRPDIDSKFFDILTQDQLSTVVSFFATNVPASGRIFLNPDGGIVTIGTIAPNVNSLLDIASTTQGVLLPRMTTVQKDAVPNTLSLMVNDTDLNTLERNSGVEWRSFATQGDTTREAWAIADFPAAAANIITLANGITSFRKSISTADRFDFGTSQNILFNGVDNLNLSLTYTGVVTFFTATANGGWNVNNLAVICSGNNAQVFDITGADMDINSSNFTMTGTGATIGEITDTSEVFMRDLNFTGYENGFTTSGLISGFVLEDTIFRSSRIGTGASVNITDFNTAAIEIDTCAFILGLNESAFNIEASITNTVSIQDTFVPLGQFFKTAANGTFSAASDEGETNAVSSVSDGSPNAIFNISGSFTNVVDNDIIVHTTFGESTYNGTFQIFNIAGTAYEIRDPITNVAVAFVAGDTGTGTTSLTRFTATAHGVVATDDVIVTSTNYDEVGSDVRGTPLTNSFDLRIPFNATDTGIWQADLFEFSGASDLSASNTITSVETIPLGARFVASGGISSLSNLDRVTHSGFATALQYNGVFTITNVQANSYDVERQPAQFTVTDTGTSDSNLTRFDIILHGLSTGTAIQLKSPLYNTGGKIKSVLNNSIDVGVAFNGTDSGIANANSLDQTDPRVIVKNSSGSGASPDSTITAEMHFENVASPILVTISTAGTPVSFLTTSWTDDSLERFTADGNGVLTFRGRKATDVLVNFSILFEKLTGGSTEIGVGLFFNGAAITDFVFPRSVNTGIIQVSGTRTITMNTDDTLEMVVVNFGDTNNIEVSQADIIITGDP